MGLFQGALQILQRIVVEMQEQGGIGAISGKQLSVILNQVNVTGETLATVPYGNQYNNTIVICLLRVLACYGTVISITTSLVFAF